MEFSSSAPSLPAPLAAGVSPRYAALALSSLVTVLLSITVGSIVRVTGNGLGCPDWPLCYGQAIPPWVVSPWVEFSHRLLGAALGAHLAALVFLALRHYRREAWIVRPVAAAVGLLVVQIGLGGVHVLFELPAATGWIHTAVAMGLAALIASQVAVTHAAARRLSALAAPVVARDRGLPAAVATTAVLTYFLIMTGSYVTRTGASLACPAFPYCGEAALALPALMRIQMFHRFTAYSVALSACLTLWRLARAARPERAFRAVTFALTALIAIQFGLGISNVLLRLPMWSRTLHLLVAALWWTGLVMVWVTLRRREA